MAANKDDLEAAKTQGLDSALIDRLTLTSEGITSMVEGLLQIASLADPIGEISDLKYRPFRDPGRENAGAARCNWGYL